MNNDCNAEYANGTGFRRFPSVSGGTAGLAVKVATGSYTGDGSATSISHGLGTTPKVVMVWHDQDNVPNGWVLRTNQHSGSTSINFPTGSGNSRLASDSLDRQFGVRGLGERHASNLKSGVEKSRGLWQFEILSMPVNLYERAICKGELDTVEATITDVDSPSIAF